MEKKDRSDEESVVWACLYTWLETVTAGFMHIPPYGPRGCVQRVRIPSVRYHQHALLAPPAHILL